MPPLQFSPDPQMVQSQTQDPGISATFSTLQGVRNHQDYNVLVSYLPLGRE